MKSSKNILGGLLIVIGILWMLNSLLGIRIIRKEDFWPLIVLAMGVAFEAAYFYSGKGPGMLVPGGIFLTIGILFVFETLTRWHFSAYTWPVYPFAVAVGLFQLYYFGGRKKGLLIPVVILCAVSGMSLASMIFGNIFRILNRPLIVAGIFIIAGIIMIAYNSEKK